jgi:cell division septum initiation protein DivIVA
MNPEALQEQVDQELKQILQDREDMQKKLEMLQRRIEYLQRIIPAIEKLSHPGRPCQSTTSPTGESISGTIAATDRIDRITS